MDDAVVSAVGVPGVVRTGGYREGLYRVLPAHPPGPHIQHISKAGPYPRPNEGNSEVIDEVS